VPPAGSVSLDDKGPEEHLLIINLPFFFGAAPSTAASSLAISPSKEKILLKSQTKTECSFKKLMFFITY
jgi:hypothetical protein